MDGRDIAESIVGYILLAGVVIGFPLALILQKNYVAPRTKIEYIVKKDIARVNKSVLEKDMSGEGMILGQTGIIPGDAMGGMLLGSGIKNKYKIITFKGKEVTLSFTNNENLYNKFNDGDLVNLTYKERDRLFYQDTNQKKLLEKTLERNELINAERITNK